MTTQLTLEQWLRQPGPDKMQEIVAHTPAIGIHDGGAIAHQRTELWNLSDYYVSTVTGGVIWLCPKGESK